MKAMKLPLDSIEYLVHFPWSGNPAGNASAILGGTRVKVPQNWGIWVARYLGVQQFGLLNYAIAFVAIFNPLANLGLDVVVVRRLVADPTQQQSILGTSFWMRFVAGWLTWLAVIIGIYSNS